MGHAVKTTIQVEEFKRAKGKGKKAPKRKVVGLDEGMPLANDPHRPLKSSN